MATITRLFKHALYLSIFSILIGGTCKKNGTSCISNIVAYTFLTEGVAKPEKITYSLGDTIYISVSVPFILNDLNTSSRIDYSNAAAISGEIGLGVIDTVTAKLLPALDSFGWISFRGRFFENGRLERSGLNFDCEKSDTAYLFSGAIICKKNGIYVFSLGDLGSPGLIGKNCTRALIRSSLKFQYRNFALFEEKLGVRPDAVGVARGFCFRVH
jgi:hypothetical protein